MYGVVVNTPECVLRGKGIVKDVDTVIALVRAEVPKDIILTFGCHLSPPSRVRFFVF